MKLREWTGREYLALGAAGVTLTLLAGGGWALQSRRQAAAAAPPSSDAETFVLPAQGDGGDAPGAAAEGEPAPRPSATPAPEKLTVYVTGAVKRPGVYLLKPGTRIYQAIHAAGGFKPNARQDALNIADEVRDADQINVPTKEAYAAATGPARSGAAPAARRGSSGSAPPPLSAFAPLPTSRRSGTASPPSRITPIATVIPGSGGTKPDAPREPGRIVGLPPAPVADPAPAAGDGGAQAAPGGDAPSARSSSASTEKLHNPGDGTVHLNSATSAELQKLPGVGPSTAEKILAYRQQIGRFTDPKQLMDVKG